MPDGSGRSSFRLFARAGLHDSKKSVQFIKGWLPTSASRPRSSWWRSNRLTEIIGQGKFDMFEWGWVVEPDPDYQLSTFTCGKRQLQAGGDVLANLSDSFYCNPAYDKLYEQQKVDHRPRPSGPTSSSRCRRCSTTTRPTS